MSALVLQPTSVTPMPGVQTLKVLTAAAVSGALKGTAKTVQVKKIVSVISQISGLKSPPWLDEDECVTE